MKNLLLLLLFSTGICQAQGVLQQSSFETAFPTGYDGCKKSYSPFACIDGSTSYANTISSLFKRSGNFSWRQEIRPGDPATFYGSWRAEISMTTKNNAASIAPNAFRWSILIPSGANSALVKEYIAGMQRHPWATGTDGGSPSFATEIKNGRWVGRIRHTGTNTSVSAPVTELSFDLGPMVKDTWYDFVVYNNATSATTGRCIVWINGKNVMDYTGRTLHAWSRPPFDKVGTYWWNRPASGTSADYRITYMDLVAYGKVDVPESTLNIMQITGPTPPTVNKPPVIVPSNPTPVVRSTTSATGVVYVTATDPGGSVASYLWSQTSGPNTATFSSTSVPNPNISNLVPGSYIFNVVVTDNLGLQSSAQINLKVNKAPLVDVTMNTDSVFVKTVTSISVSSTSSDPDGTVASVKWSVIQGEGSFANDAIANTTFTPTNQGTYILRMTVIDNDGEDGSQDYTFKIEAGYLISGFLRALPVH